MLSLAKHNENPSNFVYKKHSSNPEVARIMLDLGFKEPVFDAYLALQIQDDDIKIPDIFMMGAEVSEDYQNYYFKKLKSTDTRVISFFPKGFKRLTRGDNSWLISGETGFYALLKLAGEVPSEKDQLVSCAMVSYAEEIKDTLIRSLVFIPSFNYEIKSITTHFYVHVADQLVRRFNIQRVLCANIDELDFLGFTSRPQQMASAILLLRFGYYHLLADEKWSLLSLYPAHHGKNDAILPSVAIDQMQTIYDWLNICIVSNTIEKIDQILPQITIPHFNKEKLMQIVNKIQSWLALFDVYPLPLDRIEAFMPDRYLINVFNYRGMTLLHCAVDEDEIDVMNLLMLYRADLNALDSEGLTSLDIATRNDNERSVKVLLQAGCNINTPGLPIAAAAENGNWGLVKLFMQHNQFDAEHEINKLFLWKEILKQPYHLKYMLQLSGNQNLLIKGTPLAHLIIQHDAPLDYLSAIIKSKEDANKRDTKGRTALHMAVREASLPAIEMLLTLGADPNMLDYKMKAPLHFCRSYNADEKIIKKLIDGGALINAQDKDGRTILYSSLDNAELFQWLVNHHANIHLLDKNSGSIAHHAAKRSSMDIMKVIIASGVDLNAEDGKGNTPLLCAASGNNWEMVDFLLPQTRNIATRNKKGFNLLSYMLQKPGVCIAELEEIIQLGISIDADDFNSLQMNTAADMSRFDLVKWLHNKGVPLTRGDSSILHAAILHDDIKKVIWLLQNGANAEASPSAREHYTPFSIAVCAARIEIIKLLLQRNVNIVTKNEYGNHIIGNVILLPDIDIIKIILDKYIQMNVEADVFYLGLKRCIEMDRWEVARFIIETGQINIESTAFDKMGIFHCLARKKEFHFAAWLYQYGVNVNKQNTAGNTAFHLALESYNEPMVTWLFPLVKDFHVVNSRGQSLLHLAACYGDMEVLKEILARGVDVKMRCNQDYTALHYALLCNHDHVYEYLVSHIEIKPDNSGLLLLHRAIERNKTGIVLNLLKRGLSLTAKVNGWDGLDVAINSSHFAMAELLLTEASVKLQRYHHKHLITVVEAGKKHLVALLLDHGANINVFNRVYQTRPIFAALRKKQWDIVDLLIERGADLSMKCSMGDTVLHLAAIEGNIELCEKFKRLGVNLHEQNHHNDNICDIAFRRTDWHVFSWGLENGIHPDITTLQQDSSFMNLCIHALKKGHLTVAKWMHKNHISFDAKCGDDLGKELIVFSVANEKHWNVVDYLIEQGINLTNTDVNYLLISAIKAGSLNTVRLLYPKKDSKHCLCGLASYYHQWDIVNFLLTKETPNTSLVSDIVKHASRDGNMAVLNQLTGLNVKLTSHDLEVMLRNTVECENAVYVENLLAKGARCSYELIERAILNLDWQTAMLLIKHMFDVLLKDEKINLLTKAIWFKRIDIAHYIIKTDLENKEIYEAIIRGSVLVSAQFKQQLFDLLKPAISAPGLKLFDGGSPLQAAPATAHANKPQGPSS